jgi:glycosyltransferase involved in cell wall biosynthesis
LRILVISNLYPPDVIGGYELGCRQVVDALTAMGHDVLVLTSSSTRASAPHSGVRRHLVLKREIYGGPAPTNQAIALRRAEGRVINAHNVAVLVDTLGEFQPDVVYLWNLDGLGAYGIAATIAYVQQPAVWHLMDAGPNEAATLGPGDAGPETPLLRALSRRLRSVYIACSRRVAEEVSGSGFDFRGNLRVLPNWATTPTHEVNRQFFTSGSRKLKIVSAGQLVPHKGVYQIIETAALLSQQGRVDFHIDIFGSGLDDHFASLIALRDVDRLVTLRGYLPQRELVEKYWSCDVFLMPTWSREPFGFAALEAARRGCVPIVSRDCGYAEWFVDGLHCLKVAPTPEHITNLLREILDGQRELEPIARRALGVTQDDFSLACILPEIERAFDDALHLPPRRPGSLHDAHRLAKLADGLLFGHLEGHA